MKINKMTGYAFRILQAIYTEEDPIVTCNMIAQKEQISPGVVMKVITSLRTSGVVESHQGRGKISGGYSIMRPLDEITCLEIIEIMEGPVKLNIREETEDQFAINEELNRIEEIIREEMRRHTMADIIHNSEN